MTEAEWFEYLGITDQRRGDAAASPTKGRARRFRFTMRLRTLLTLVAAVAVLLGGGREYSRMRRWADFSRRQADYHALEKSIYDGTFRGCLYTWRPPPAEVMAERAVYHGRLRRLWERAASRPWEPFPTVLRSDLAGRELMVEYDLMEVGLSAPPRHLSVPAIPPRHLSVPAIPPDEPPQ